jgi:hypothetical protein
MTVLEMIFGIICLLLFFGAVLFLTDLAKYPGSFLFDLLHRVKYEPHGKQEAVDTDKMGQMK